jgi:hypothetical protein
MVSTKHAALLENGMGFEKTRPGGNPIREDEETIVADSTGHVKHSSGMVVDTHYAAQLRPSRLTGRGLTFMVSHQPEMELIVGHVCRRYWVHLVWIRSRSHVGIVDFGLIRAAIPPDGRRIRGFQVFNIAISPRCHL